MSSNTVSVFKILTHFKNVSVILILRLARTEKILSASTKTDCSIFLNKITISYICYHTNDSNTGTLDYKILSMLFQSDRLSFLFNKRVSQYKISVLVLMSKTELFHCNNQKLLHVYSQFTLIMYVAAFFFFL